MDTYEVRSSRVCQAIQAGPDKLCFIARRWFQEGGEAAHACCRSAEWSPSGLRRMVINLKACALHATHLHVATNRHIPLESNTLPVPIRICARSRIAATYYSSVDHSQSWLTVITLPPSPPPGRCSTLATFLPRSRALALQLNMRALPRVLTPTIRLGRRTVDTTSSRSLMKPWANVCLPSWAKPSTMSSRR